MISGRDRKSCHSDQRLALPEISPSMKPSKIGRTRALVQRASWLTLVDDSNALCRSAAWQRRRVRIALTYRLVGFGMPIEPSVPRDEGWRAQDEAPSCQRVTRATVALDKVGINFTLHSYDYDPDAERVGLQAAEDSRHRASAPPEDRHG